uniref:Uncharacterized protein n=1 Tax=Talaromyces marneffei PM1 TaxID=1077442 RepID=A0A093V968_TALMA
MDDFVFLNTTNAPGLSPEAAKRVRGHITKSNFAKRRQRIITENPDVNKENNKRNNKNNPSKNRLSTSTDVRAASSDPTRNNKDLQLLILLSCLNPPTTNPSEAEWVDLVASEQALIEATMAVGMRHWSPQPSWQLQADFRSSRALTSIIKQISWKQTYTDGFLAAIMTMAFGARLLPSHEQAWDVHVDGLVQLINERRLRRIREPGWFWDGLVLFWHRKVIDVIGDSAGGLRVRQVAEICEGIMELRRSINQMYHTSHIDTRFVAEDIDKEATRLREKSQKLGKSKKNKYVSATALTLELIVCLLWPTDSQLGYTHNLAKDLQQTTSQLPKMPCPYMDLTSCQFIIGAVAAEHGSSTKTWFVDKLTSAARAMQERGWSDEPFEILQRMLRADESLMGWFGIEGGRDGISKGYEDMLRQILAPLKKGC